MIALASFAILTTLLFSPALSSTAQSPQAESKPVTGSISGRITIGADPAAGVLVTLQPEFSYLESLSKAMTDEEGRFRLMDVPAGRYRVVPTAPLFLMPSETPIGLPGRLITVKAGEAIEGVEFRLMRGGVITGRVTDAKGQPVIEEQVYATLLDERGNKRPFFNSNSILSLNQTDDRGIYRLFGLPPGRYLVSAGIASPGSQIRYTSGRDERVRTYHPDTIDQAKATILEVTANGETANADIRIAPLPKLYAVAGRIVEAETGQPLPDLDFSVGTVQREGRPPGYIGSFLRSDRQGNFRIDGVAPGRYGVFLDPGKSGFYSEAVIFEVSDSDLADITIRAQRGVSVSGAVVLQGSLPPGVRAALTQLRISAYSIETGTAPYIPYAASIQPDGSFHFPSVRPGRFSLSLTGVTHNPPKGFSLMRIEGAPTDRVEALKIEPGQPVTGLRLIVAYGTGVVSGQLKVIGGTLPEGIRLQPFLLLDGQVSQRSIARTEANERGQFVFEGLPAGTYQIRWSAMGPLNIGRDLYSRIVSRLMQIVHTVTVNDGAETQVTVTLDLSEKEKTQ